MITKELLKRIAGIIRAHEGFSYQKSVDVVVVHFGDVSFGVDTTLSNN